METNWECRICKHLNELTVDICFMCDNSKPLIPFELDEDEASNGSNPRLWSEYIGYVSWGEAKQIAKSRRMRIPSLDDLLLAYRYQITIPWLRNGYGYWSNEKVEGERYLILNIENGFTEEIEAGNKRHLRLIY
jgi:hypothetical protein